MVKRLSLSAITFFTILSAFGQQDSYPKRTDLDSLLAEAVLNNPDIRAALEDMNMSVARISQVSSLENPSFTYYREEMPGFRLNEAMLNKYEFMQMIMFPTKLATRRSMAEIDVEHASYAHLERVNEVLEKLKASYYDLWYVQQNIVLQQENSRLLDRFMTIAVAKYRVREAMQQDVLKAQVELAKVKNKLVDLRSQELAMKAMLASILNRRSTDTLGLATIPELGMPRLSLDTLKMLALANRPMIAQDSLEIEQGRTLLSMAKQEYLPDLRVGVMYMDSQARGMNGWGLSFGITLPFAPWTLSKASGRVEEADATIRRSQANYRATRNMVFAKIAELHARIQSLAQQLENYRTTIIPSAQQALEASVTAYQTGISDFLMLIDSYRMIVEFQMEHNMLRVEFEQSIAQLERTVGLKQIAYHQ